METHNLEDPDIERWVKIKQIFKKHGGGEGLD